LLKPVEIALCRKADLVLTTSERDQATLQRFLPATHVEVVPNGVDVGVFHHQSVHQTSDQLIFTGAMNYYPNIEAVLSFASNCWPLIRAQVPSATWLIVGREPPLEVRRLGELPGVTVTGGVPDVRVYLASSAVALAPLRVGGGTRLKILEAFAMGKAVVSTSLGCEGLRTAHEEHLLVADHPELFARAVVRLLQDGEMRAKLGRAGRALVEEKYSWECCGAQLLRVLKMHVPERKQVCL
jgi:glycosyltransferase involved in cell wall biosynthesis